MSILARFKDIMASNINALLDKAENPEKMIDQILRNLNKDLGAVKGETASIMAQEQRAKRELDECIKEMDQMEKYAIKALESGNEDDARKFLERKSSLAKNQEGLENSYELSRDNAIKMREMHDKLVADIGELESKRSMIKGKMSVAKTQERINKIGSTVDSAGRSISAFERMEEKANRVLDEANAMAELNKGPKNDIKNLAAKYDLDTSVEDELSELKKRLSKE